VGLVLFGLAAGLGPARVLTFTTPVVLCALVAAVPGRRRTVRASFASVGLITASAVLVAFTHGAIEAHFDFFVALAVIALYQEWIPYLLAIAYVVLEHGVVGALASASVYNHESAVQHPWRWALRHAGFVAAASAANIATWRAAEAARTREATARGAAELAEAKFRTLVEQLPAITYVESVGAGTTYMSPQVRTVLGYEPHELLGSSDTWLALTHPDDRPRVADEMARTDGSGEPFDMEYRVKARDGRWVWFRTQARLMRDERGAPQTWVGFWTDITAQKSLEERLSHQATHDALTGLSNRASFIDRLERTTLAARDETVTGVLYIDLDGFKQINDTLGHAAGDALLVAVAARLRGALRAGDNAARLGGDEFAILLPEAGGELDVRRVAERVIESLQQPLDLHGHEVIPSGSVGVAVARGADITAAELLQAADADMYALKQGRKGGLRVLPPTPAPADVPIVVPWRQLKG
jgi:diguanylate cyclase (GGDEF)-like protein/PAS domain S-box-containing protein